jgi:hypothetical protein
VCPGPGRYNAHLPIITVYLIVIGSPMPHYTYIRVSRRPQSHASVLEADADGHIMMVVKSPFRL